MQAVFINISDAIILRTPQIEEYEMITLRPAGERGHANHVVRQLYLPVRWTQCVQALASRGVLQVAECGPGKVLTGLAKRIDKSLEARPLATVGEFQSALEEWKA